MGSGRRTTTPFARYRPVCIGRAPPAQMRCTVARSTRTTARAPYGWCRNNGYFSGRAQALLFLTIHMEDRIVLLCNPTAENARALRLTDEIGQELKRHGLRFASFTNRWPDTLDGFTQAWIVGGDGTLNWFLNQYPDTDLPIAAIPGGSANDFHYTLYDGAFESTAADMTARMLQGRTRAIDAGTCNGRLFINGVGIGFDGAIVKDLIGKKKLAGKASYLLSVLKHIMTYQEKFISVSGSALSMSGDCLLLSIANGKRYGGDFQVAPRAVPDDGLFDVNFVGRIAPLRRMRYLPVIEKGEHLELPFVMYAQGSDMTVECAQEIHAHVDGEYLSAARFEIRCFPKRYRFFV
ncbi:MAG: YegS/Rv2252/BmrU family lipid kinase [Chitinophagaceae bacterium]|nr:MAG: YegS/Rv2252/BmrU family lipid kinase [Chitinophagaceae bacterium]